MLRDMVIFTALKQPISEIKASRKLYLLFQDTKNL